MRTAPEQLVVPGHVERHALDEYPRIGFGSSLADRYSVIMRLGGGAYADVLHAIDWETGADVAVKSFKEPSESAETSDDRELEIHTALQNHPNVIAVFDEGVHDDYGVPQRYIATLLAEGGNLLQDGPLSSVEVAKAGLAIVRGIRAVHGLGFLYGDAKPDNVLRHNGSYLLTDFGAATPLNTPNTGSTAIGSLGTMPPEAFLYGVQLGTSTDVYGIGGTMFAAATGRLPIPLHKHLDLGEQERHYRITQVQSERPPSVQNFAPDLEPELVEIIDSCLPRDAAKRIRIAKLERALETLVA